MNQTIDYYNQNAKQYIERTQNFDVSYLFNAFINRLPQGAKVLDAGCGSGRDSLAFQKLGFDVLAIDAAEEFIKHVAQLGIATKKMWLEEIDFEEEFDGVWCCASLVHVQKELLPDVIARIYRALKKEGIAFFSFKMGAGEGEESGRYFHYVDEERLLSYLANYEILDRLNNSSDKNQTPTSWISVIVKKP